MTKWELCVLFAYFTLLAILSLYGLHRGFLVFLFLRHRRRRPKPSGRLPELPSLTVQIPLYNERYVAARAVDAAAALDYPRDRLEIQILDDSTDETAEIVSRRVGRWAKKGLRIRCLRRGNRDGFKAGALAGGMRRASGEFFAIFDADFVPPRDFLRRLLPYFADPKVGMVQARWGHLNRDRSLLTKLQGLLVDGHFILEHGARNRSGRFFNFNGSAGIWRRACLEEAGGWQPHTLTEDLDLSYRAQLQGWRFVFEEAVVAPAELPEGVGALRSQYQRWMKGSMQVCRKLLPSVVRSRFPWPVKLEAAAHLTASAAYVWMSLLCLLMPLAFAARARQATWAPLAYLDLALFLAATASTVGFYAVSQREIEPRWTRRVGLFPLALALGVGLSLNNALGVLEAWLGTASPFVRTPKLGEAPSTGAAYRSRPPLWLALVEFLLGAYLLLGAWIAARAGLWAGAFFFLLFAAGFLYVSGLTFLEIATVPAKRRTATGKNSAHETQGERAQVPCFTQSGSTS